VFLRAIDIVAQGRFGFRNGAPEGS